MVANSVKCQLVQWLGDKGDDTNLSQQDIDLGVALNFKFKKLKRTSISLKDWQITKNEEDFLSWLSKQTLPSLFFDGVAKGNTGIAGAGGLIIKPDETSLHRFAWGLGHSSSIQVEAMALFQGIKLLKELGLKEQNVFGDSQVIFKAVATNSNPTDLQLARIITRIKGMAKSLKLKYFHVLRTNNKEADIEANKAVQLVVGTILRNNEIFWDPIP